MGPFPARTSRPFKVAAMRISCVCRWTLVVLSCFAHSSIAEDVHRSPVVRTRVGLSVLYHFDDRDGPIIEDCSGVGKPLNLRVENPNRVRREGGGLWLQGKTRIASERPAKKIVAAIQRSGEMTIEVWLRSADPTQVGPARVVTLSKDAMHRNVSLGQEGDRWDLRLRTTKTSDNGIPSMPASKESVSRKLTHVVFTRGRNATARLFVNGQLNREQKISGSLSNWDTDFRLVLGDEFSGGRSWRGALHMVAIYHRSLTANEVSQHFRLGANAKSPEIESSERRLFAKSIAPILAEHCLECHDAPTRQGGLDLSHRQSALIGGDSGAVMVAGDASASRLWQTIHSDEMPPDRPPLSDEEKRLLFQWIENGADWTVDFLDPVLYSHRNRVADQLWVQRLTRDEYVASVHTAVGVDISAEAEEFLPRDLRADGFANTAYNLSVDFEHVEAYAQLAERIVDRMDVAAFARRFSKSRRFTDSDMGELIEGMGKWVLRGPIEEHEVIAYRGISTTVASAGGNFAQAVGLIVEAMLQSPKFLYRVEAQVGDGTAWPVDDYELASRMSFILWGGPPDQALIEAAESGNLRNPEIRDRQVERLLADPRAAARAQQFVTQWLNLDGLSNLQPDRKRFSDWNPKLAEDMRRETLAFFEHVAWRKDRRLADLLTAQITFATPELAAHYRLRSQPKSDGPQIQAYDLTEDPARGGLLTQGSVLTIGGDEASMVTRGLFVLHNLLRGHVKDPPPCVDTTPTPTQPGLTQRTIAQQRIKNEACGGCHAKFEPLAFGLERFDGLGSYSELDAHGNLLLDRGQVLFPGEAEAVPYQSSQELMELLASNSRVRESLTWKVTQFAMGRPLNAADAPVVKQIHESSQSAGGTYRSIMRALIASDLVQNTLTELSPETD